MADLDTMILEPQIKFREKLVRCGNNSSLYKSGFYPHIQLILHDNSDIISINGECNSLDLDPNQLRTWYIEVDGNLDELLKRIDQNHGELAPGFTEQAIDSSDQVEPVFRDLKWDPNRKLTIYTWGKKYRDRRPPESKCNFNAEVINGQKSGFKEKGISLKSVNGLNYDVQQSVKVGRGYINFMRDMIIKIESDNLLTISINCTAGRHRSVSCAEILKREFYSNAIIYHLEINGK